MFEGRYSVIPPELDGDPDKSLAILNEVIQEEKPEVIIGTSLDEYLPEDFMHLKKYIHQNIPAHKVMVLMPHLLMELYQLNEYISPKIIVR